MLIDGFLDAYYYRIEILFRNLRDFRGVKKHRLCQENFMFEITITGGNLINYF